MSTKTRFEKEAKGNSEMVYFHLACKVKILACTVKMKGKKVARAPAMLRKLALDPKSNKIVSA